MKYFNDIGINDEIVAILKTQGFIHPTLIQEKAIPLILEGRDMIGQAETGSGKTSACGIPLIQQVDKEIKDVQILILTPTRELAMQYLMEVSSIATPYGITPFVVYGGFDKDIQMSKLKSGVQILVATPGRLIDIIYNHQFSIPNIKTLVIDEADEMLKMGFIEDIDFIKSCIVKKHQTLLFSATMPPEIKKLAKAYLSNAAHIKLNAQQKQPDTLTHAVVKVSRRDKNSTLKTLINEEKIVQALIFCNTRSRVSRLFSEIKKTVANVDFIHGGLEQSVRSRIVDKFRRKKIKYLITTDVMARGIDIRGVSHIINYDLTDNPEIYIHRSGRTARLGKDGVSISFVSPEDRENLDRIIAVSGINPEQLKLKPAKSQKNNNFRKKKYQSQDKRRSAS